MSGASEEMLPLKSKRIIIVDDDTVSRIFFRELLGPSGAELHFLRNGYELLKFIELYPEPDAILLDVKLPDCDGVELAAQLLANRPNLRIIAETAYTIEGIEAKCLNYGLKGCIYKPVNKEKLLNLLVKVVQ